MDSISVVFTIPNPCPKVNPSVSKISLPLHSASVIDYASQVFHVSDTDFISGALKSFQQDMKGYYLCVGNKLYLDDAGWLGDFFMYFYAASFAENCPNNKKSPFKNT